MNITRAAIVVALLLAFPSAAQAESGDFSFKIETGVEYLLGYTQYGIGWMLYDQSGMPVGLIGSEISRLKFPLNAFLIYADIEMKLFGWLRLAAHGSCHLPGNPGRVEDSDWGVWYWDSASNTWASQTSLDVFSQSDGNLTAYSLDASLHYDLPLVSAFSVSFGLGFIYQYVFTEVSNLDQWYPSYAEYSAYIPASYANHDYLAGLVGTYQVQYFIPLAEARVEYRAGSVFSFGLLAGITPLLFFKDEDDHIVRMKLSDASGTGLGMRCVFICRLALTSWLSLAVQARCLFLHAEGKQTQVSYDPGSPGYIATIKTKLDSLQFSAGMSVGISF